MSDPEENVKARIQPKIRAALVTVARERHPYGFRIDKDDFKKFMEIITIERIIPNDSCKPNAPQHEHTVDLSVQADFKICVYSTFSGKGAAIGCGLGTAVGAVGGTAGGIGAGVLYDYILSVAVPGSNSIFGIFGGGIVGVLGGVLTGGGFGACIGAHAAAADSSMVCASQVFVKFEEYLSDETHNTCHCVLTTPTQCPSGDGGSDNEKQNDIA